MDKFLKKLIPGFAVAAGAIGCTVGPDYTPPKTKMPAAFSATQPATQPGAQGATVNLERWWESFNDPMLDSLIGRAVRTNLDLRIARSRVRKARGQLVIQRADIYPKLNANGSYNHNRFSKEGFYIPGAVAGGSVLAGNSAGAGASANGGTLGHVSRDVAGGATTNNNNTNQSGLASAFSRTEIDTFQGGFDASWEVDLFGGVRRSVEAAGADEQAAIESRRDTMISLLAEIARNYVDLRGTQRELAIAVENIRSQQDTVDLTRSRFQAGLATDLDVARAEAQVASTRAAVPSIAHFARPGDSPHQRAAGTGADRAASGTDARGPDPHSHSGSSGRAAFGVTSSPARYSSRRASACRRQCADWSGNRRSIPPILPDGIIGISQRHVSQPGPA